MVLRKEGVPGIHIATLLSYPQGGNRERAGSEYLARHLQFIPGMAFDRFDICEAYALYAYLWGHDTYTRSIQARLSRLKFKPRDSASCISGLTDNGRDIYFALVQRVQDLPRGRTNGT